MSTATTANSFDKLVKRLYPRVFSFAMKLTRNVDAAADLTQETFVRAYRANSGRRKDIDPVSWFFRITYHCYLDQRRMMSRRPNAVSIEGLGQEGREFELVDERPDPEQVFFDGRLSPRMASAIQALSDDQRELIRLADLEELSHAELARIYGCGATTIKTRIHRAHVALKRHLATFDVRLTNKMAAV